MPKTTVRDSPRTNGWTLAHCPPSSEWGPGGNTGEIKAARKGTGHPTSKADCSGQVSSLTGTPQRTDRIWDLPLPLYTKWTQLNYKHFTQIQLFLLSLHFLFLFLYPSLSYYISLYLALTPSISFLSPHTFLSLLSFHVIIQLVPIPHTSPHMKWELGMLLNTRKK